MKNRYNTDETDYKTGCKTAYETDLYLWVNQQAYLLRSLQFSQVDIENIAMELEDMGRSLQRELVSRLKVLLMHLLKWQYQPNYQSNSWRYTIVGQRDELTDLLDENPSLKSQLEEAIVKGYRYALNEAAKETGLIKETFPAFCPWSFAEIIDPDFWPKES